MLEFQPRNLSFRVSAYNLSTSYPGTFREAIRVISVRGTRPCMLMAGKGEGRVMRRRRKSVRNVDDHRRGSIMARISRFYYFNAGRRGPRDSHTHSPILAWESFHSPPLSGCTVFSLSRRSRLYDRKLIVSWVPYGEIRTLRLEVIEHPPPFLTKLSIFQYFGSIEYSNYGF